MQLSDNSFNFKNIFQLHLGPGGKNTRNNGRKHQAYFYSQTTTSVDSRPVHMIYGLSPSASAYVIIIFWTQVMAFHELLPLTYRTALQLSTSVDWATWLRNERHINFARISNSRSLETPGDSIFRTLDCSNLMVSSFLSFRLMCHPM